MIGALLSPLPAWILAVLDTLMILGALAGLCYLGEKLVARIPPGRARHPGEPMRTADARQIEREVSALGHGVRPPRPRPMPLPRRASMPELRPSYPPQHKPAAEASNISQEPTP